MAFAFWTGLVQIMLIFNGIMHNMGEKKAKYFFLLRKLRHLLSVFNEKRFSL